MKMRLHQFELPLAHPFTISRGTITSQPTLIVELCDDTWSGFGEATANDYYGHTCESMIEGLERHRETIENAVWETPAELWSLTAKLPGLSSFAQCAVDLAAHDLWGKRQGRSTLEALGGSFDQPRPSSNFTIGLDSIPRMIEKLRETPDWPCYKIKLGTPEDVEIVRRLREVTDAPFRVDANGGWTVEEALEKIPRLEQLGVELIEQPLAEGEMHLVGQVARSTSLPVVADENCQVEGDVAACAQSGFTGINIKLVKCGGLTSARRMIAEARDLGLKVMVGCMTESSVGISAIAQLLPLIDFVDMDGAALLARDAAKGVRVERGICLYDSRVGNSVERLIAFA